MQKYFLLVVSLFMALAILAQPRRSNKIIITVSDKEKVPARSATVEILSAKDSVVLQTQAADTTGKAVFENLFAGHYICRISMANYQTQYLPLVMTPAEQENVQSFAVSLQPDKTTLKAVNITAYKPLIQQLPDRTIINVDAGITNTGTTVLEVLEKSPGVSVDRSGAILLRGKPGVLIMIDGKPTYLSGADLISMLESMNASQAEQIEIIDNPSSKYDAAGNAGIINIKTKKNQQNGFNGNVNLSYGQGRYYKNNNSIVLNYRNRRFNYFLNYSINTGKNFLDLYALRTYYKPDGKTVDAILDQPTWILGKGNNNTLRTGIDYYAGNNTVLGIAVVGSTFGRSNNGNATAEWLNASGNKDSAILTQSTNHSKWYNTGINFNLKHDFSSSSQITANLDWLWYDINSLQSFKHTLSQPGGYEANLKNTVDAAIHIYAAKADYSRHFGDDFSMEAGWKSSYISTNNLAAYYNLQDDTWQADLGKTNHFLYNENIHAAFVGFEKKMDDITVHIGIRDEYTGYKANQLGNAVVKDSSFSRNYNSLFPSALITWGIDSVNKITLTTGRRIERPAFQKLNPFVFVINKYTYQQGNPFFRPQYTWNIGLSHSFKNMLTTSLDYSFVKDYFSQIFLSDSTGTIVYTEGNIGKMRDVALTVSLQTPVTTWWNISAEATLEHKQMNGLLWRAYKASFTQLSLNINNQFRFGKGWAAELSGMYTTKSQEDIQEVLRPTGMVSAGLSKQVLKNKGTIKLSMRDIFYTQVMAGLTKFELAQEYFSIKRDSRVCSISFSYRFGKTTKSSPTRSGGAIDEIERVGSS